MADAVELTILQKIDAVRESAEFKTLQDNSNKIYWDGKIGPELKTVYGSIDSIFDDILGTKKEPTEKTTAYANRVATELKELRAKVIANPNNDIAFKEKETLWGQEKTKLLADLLESNTAVKNLTQKGFENIVLNQINAQLPTKVFNPNYSKQDLEQLINLRRETAIKNSKILESGVIVYYKDADKKDPYLDGLSSPMGVGAVVDIIFDSLYHKSTAGGDAANTNNTTISPMEGDVINLTGIDSFKTVGEFMTEFKKAMAAKGYAETDEKFYVILQATSAKYNIARLPA